MAYSTKMLEAIRKQRSQRNNVQLREVRRANGQQRRLAPNYAQSITANGLSAATAAPSTVVGNGDEGLERWYDSWDLPSLS